MYTHLAKLAAHRCYDGKKFVYSERIGKDHLPVLQRRIMALLEKLDYNRARSDFREAYSSPIRIHGGNAPIRIEPIFYSSNNDPFDTIR